MTTPSHPLAHTLLALTTALVVPACEDAATVGTDIPDLPDNGVPNAAGGGGAEDEDSSPGSDLGGASSSGGGGGVDPFAPEACPLDPEAWTLLRRVATSWTELSLETLEDLDRAMLPAPGLLAFDSGTGIDHDWSCYPDEAFECLPDAATGTEACYRYTCDGTSTFRQEAVVVAADQSPGNRHALELPIGDGYVAKWAQNPRIVWVLKNAPGEDREVSAELAMDLAVQGPGGAIHDLYHTGRVYLEENRDLNVPGSLAIDLVLPDLLEEDVMISVYLDATNRAVGTITTASSVDDIATFEADSSWSLAGARWSGPCAAP